MSSKEIFPQLYAFVYKSIHLQNARLEDIEIEAIKNRDGESYEFYKEIVRCKNKDSVKNMKCLMESFSNSKCRNEYAELLQCTKYLSGRYTKKQDKVINLCYKQDYNLKGCLDDLMDPIINSIADLPVRA